MVRFATLALAGFMLCSCACHAADRGSSAKVREMLNTPLPGSVVVDFNKGVALRDALDFFRDISGASMHVNWKAVSAASIDPDTVLRFRLRGVTPRKVLNTILSEAAGGEQKLAYYIDEGTIEITSRDVADAMIYTRVYPVNDLLVEPMDEQSMFNPMMMLSGNQGMTGSMSGYGGGSSYGRGGGRGMRSGISGGSYMGGNGYTGGGGMWGQSGMTGMYPGGSWNTPMATNGTNGKGKKANPKADELVELIKATIYPKYWEDGKASIKYYNGNLVITAPRIVHEAIGGPID